MKLRFPLYLQTISMLLLYLACLLVVVAVCFNAQFGVGWDALLKSPIGDRVDTIAEAIASQLRSSPTKDWNPILSEFDRVYHVQFYVFDIFNTQLAGDPVTLPESLTGSARMALPPPPSFGGQPFFFVLSGGAHNLPPPKFHGTIAPHSRSGIFPDLHGMRPLGSQGMPCLDIHGMPPPDSHGVRAPDSHGKTAALPQQFGPQPPQDFPPPSFMHAHDRFIVHTSEPDRFWIGTRVTLTGTDLSHPIPALILASSGNMWQTSLLIDFKFAALVFGTILIISISFWWPFIFRITHALSELTLATERIAEGRFDTRLNSKRLDEIGRLSEAVNSMAERLNNFVSGQKRFLGDISHELFSPLARLQLALELLKSSATGEQQSLIDDIEEETLEMNNLINELLAFSKAGLQGKSPELVDVNLKSLVEGVVSRLDREHTIEVDIASTLNARADPLLLDRAISNVIRNSIRYARGCGPIAITASSLGEEISLVILDNGPGVPETALKNLSEPFFRLEPSRDRSSGGAGLGLAIVKTCVEACGGSLTLGNRQPHGFVVDIRLKAR